MEGVYAILRQSFSSGKLSFKSITSANLDEYVGLEPSHPQSYQAYMKEHLFDHIDIKKENAYVPNGKEEPQTMLRNFQEFLDSHPRDIQLLGVGSNGHIGFNEPAPFFTPNAHIVNLKEGTREDNGRFFESIEQVPYRAVTMGAGDILNSAQIMMLIYGDSKAQVVKKLLADDKAYPELPCSVLKLHHNATVVLSKDLMRLAEKI